MDLAAASDVGHATYERVRAGTLNGDTHENIAEEVRRMVAPVFDRADEPFSYPRESWRLVKVNRPAAVRRWYSPPEAA